MTRSMKPIHRVYATPIPSSHAQARLDVRGLVYEERSTDRVMRLEPTIASAKLVVVTSGAVELRSDSGATRVFAAGRAFVVTPSAAPMLTSHGGALECLEVTAPGWATAAVFGRDLLGLSAHGDGIAALVESDAREIDRLADALRAAQTWRASCSAVAAMIDRRVRAWSSTPLGRVRHVWRRLQAAGGVTSITDLADEVSCSPRQLRQSFRDMTGMSPKEAARRLRFERAIALIRSERAPLAEVAAACGFSDQSHMTRDVTSLAGVPPRAFQRPRPDGLPGLADMGARFTR